MIDLYQLDSKFGIASTSRDVLSGPASDVVLVKPMRYIDQAGTPAVDDQAEYILVGVMYSADTPGYFVLENDSNVQVGPRIYFAAGCANALPLFFHVGKGAGLQFDVTFTGPGGKNFSLTALTYPNRYSNRQAIAP